jgi:hypothetical protein
MRRHPHVVPFARRSVRNLLRRLTVGPPIKSPEHLRLAYEILQNELTVPAPSARRLVIDSVSHAHVCGQAIDRRARILHEYENRMQARKAFSRLAKCATRAPASVRNSLDKRIARLIPPIIDLEVIEGILDAAHRVFKSSKHEAAQCALRVLTMRDRDVEKIVGPVDEDQTVRLKTLYCSLSPTSHRDCESALSSLTRTSTPGYALAVFKALTSAIDTKPPKGVPVDVSDLTVTYVEAVAALWRQVGLRPSRATHSSNPKYKSKFHRFVDLVLTAMTEPWSNRHNPSIDQIAQRTWEAHAQFPPEFRLGISSPLRRVDWEWQVSEDHVRKALKPVEILDKSTAST